MKSIKGILAVYTGERMMPGETPDIFFFEHLRRYYFIREICRNKTILDVGCGYGYGPRFLADYAKHVTGIDIDKDAINNAKVIYRKKNLKFLLIDVSSDSLKNKRFDVICSFEVIEHIKYQKKFISYTKRLMRKNGILIISTPNKVIVSPNSSKPSNPFHIKEFNYAEFKNFLDKNFSSVEIYGQATRSKTSKLVYLMRYIRYNKHLFYAFIILLNIAKLILKRAKIWEYQKDVKRSAKMLEKSMGRYDISKENIERKTTFIAICKNPI